MLEDWIRSRCLIKELTEDTLVASIGEIIQILCGNIKQNLLLGSLLQHPQPVTKELMNLLIKLKKQQDMNEKQSISDTNTNEEQPQIVLDTIPTDMKKTICNYLPMTDIKSLKNVNTKFALVCLPQLEKIDIPFIKLTDFLFNPTIERTLSIDSIRSTVRCNAQMTLNSLAKRYLNDGTFWIYTPNTSKQQTISIVFTSKTANSSTAFMGSKADISKINHLILGMLFV